MNLYIEIQNGKTINHPAYENNLIEAFGSVPNHWEFFVRVEQPKLEIYQVFTDPKVTYEKLNEIWTDVFHVRDMTIEEKLFKQQATKDAWASRDQAENWSAWILDEATCTMQPPIPRPQRVEGVLLFWCGADNNWKVAPPRPEGLYQFDFFVWQWVAL